MRRRIPPPGDNDWRSSRRAGRPPAASDQDRRERPIILAIDEQFSEGAALRVAPELADPATRSKSGSIRSGVARRSRKLTMARREARAYCPFGWPMPEEPDGANARGAGGEPGARWPRRLERRGEAIPRAAPEPGPRFGAEKPARRKPLMLSLKQHLMDQARSIADKADAEGRGLQRVKAVDAQEKLRAMVDGDGAPDPDTGDDGGPPRDGSSTARSWPPASTARSRAPSRSAPTPRPGCGSRRADRTAARSATAA